nr:UDP-N-acetylglucosamine transferase subunit [Haemonchus contortus]
MLCETSRGHFDLVIRREDHANLALAQSILYEALYIGVFGFSRETIKESIAKVREDMDAVGVDVQTPTSDDVPGQPTDDFSFNDGSNHSSALAWRPPIPYSSIKALDPSVYRNLSYDLFLKNKRQKGDYGIFRSGSPCLIMEGESCYRAFVLSVPDKHSRMVLVNGIERRVSVSRLLPLSCHISPIQTVPSSRFATNTEHSETAQTAPPREIFPWLSVVPFSYEYWTETFTVQYLCQMRPNGCVTPSSNFAYVNYPWSYAGSVSSCESTSVFVGVPLDSSYEYMASRSFEHRAAAMVPYNAGFHFVSGSLQNSALCY